MTSERSQPSGNKLPAFSIRDEIKVSVGARQELGPAFDDELLDLWVSRLETAIQSRMRMDQEANEIKRQDEARRFRRQLCIAAMCMAWLLPLSLLASSVGGIVGLIVAWTFILALYRLVSQTLGGRGV